MSAQHSIRSGRRQQIKKLRESQSSQVVQVKPQEGVVHHVPENPPFIPSSNTLTAIRIKSNIIIIPIEYLFIIIAC